MVVLVPCSIVIEFGKVKWIVDLSFSCSVSMGFGFDSSRWVHCMQWNSGSFLRPFNTLENRSLICCWRRQQLCVCPEKLVTFRKSNIFYCPMNFSVAVKVKYQVTLTKMFWPMNKIIIAEFSGFNDIVCCCLELCLDAFWFHCKKDDTRKESKTIRTTQSSEGVQSRPKSLWVRWNVYSTEE